jgi:hypothetical protein
MLKFTSSALGLLIMMVVAPSAPAATHQNRSLQRVNRELHVQKLAPIKLAPNQKSGLLKSKIINTLSPTSASKAPSLTEDERQQIDLRPNTERDANIKKAPRDVRDLPGVAF